MNDAPHSDKYNLVYGLKNNLQFSLTKHFFAFYCFLLRFTAFYLKQSTMKDFGRAVVYVFLLITVLVITSMSAAYLLAVAVPWLWHETCDWSTEILLAFESISKIWYFYFFGYILLLAIAVTMTRLLGKKVVNRNQQPSKPLTETQIGPKRTARQREIVQQIRLMNNPDCIIVSEDNVGVEVHSVWLKTVWPYFLNYSEKQGLKNRSNRLLLPYPFKWIAAMIAYLYHDSSVFDFDTATGLLVMCHVYHLPHLLKVAEKRIQTEKLDLKKSVIGWQRAYLGCNLPLRRFFATFAARHTCDFDSSDFIVPLSPHQLKQLVRDLMAAR